MPKSALCYGGCAVLCMLVAGGADAAPSLNLPQVLADTKAKLAAGGTANVVVLGDSISFRGGSYLYPFRDKLHAHYGNAGSGWQGMSLWTGGGFNPGWTNGQINDDTAPFRSLDGLWASSSQHASGFLDADAVGGHVDVKYTAGPGGGSFRVLNPNLTPITTINTAAATNEVRTYSYTFAPGQRELWYEPLGDGPVTILGQDNSTGVPGIKVHRGANGGWGVNNFLQRDWTFDALMPQLDTDLVMVWIGTNDAAYTGAQYVPKTNALVDRIEAASPGAEIVLVGSYDLGNQGHKDRVDAIESVAAARGLGFISMFEAGGSYASIQANGWLDDEVHLSAAGGEHFGQLMYDAFITNGASLVPEPSTAIFLLPLAGWALGRRRDRAFEGVTSVG